jgi:hypothetical protein
MSLVARLALPTAAVLVAAGLAAAPAVAAPHRDAPVEARVGELTTRAGNGTGAQRLTSASVRQDLVAGTVSGTFVLDAEPGPSAYLRVTFGELNGNNCQGDLEVNTSTTALDPEFTRSGRTYTMSAAVSQASYATWDCAFAALADDLSDSPTTYSLLGGPLTDVLAQPQLAIDAPTLLDSAKLKLVPGVWTTLEVQVRNTGRADAPPVALSGKGKGLKVKPDTTDYPLYGGGSGVLRIRVKLTRAKPAKMTLTAAAGASTATRTAKVKPVGAPAAPLPGKYRAKKADLSFTIAGGKVKGFRIYTQTTCGGYPSLPTYTMNTYTVPDTRIPRSGIVDRLDVKSLYSVMLRMKVVRGKVTKGYFRYYQPDSRCEAIETFTARRTGR